MIYFSHQKDELNKEPKTEQAVVWRVGGYGSSFLFMGKLNNFSVFRFLNCKMGIIPASLSQGASLIAQLVKNPPAMWEAGFNPWVGKIPWRRERLPTPVFWPGEFHGLYSLWGHKELDMTEWLNWTELGGNYVIPIWYFLGFPCDSAGKESACNVEDLLEKEYATHSSILGLPLWLSW